MSLCDDAIDELVKRTIERRERTRMGDDRNRGEIVYARDDVIMRAGHGGERIVWGDNWSRQRRARGERESDDAIDEKLAGRTRRLKKGGRGS